MSESGTQVVLPVAVELKGLPRRTIEGSWHLNFWYHCTDHPEFMATNRPLAQGHFRREHGFFAYRIFHLLNEAEDEVVAAHFGEL